MAQDKVFEVADTATVTLQDLNDILTTAVEGGIGYWADIKEYRWENVDETTVMIKENDQDSAEKPGWIAVKSTDLLPILPLISKHSGQAKGWNIAEIIDQCDADIADIAVQLLVFGEVIYG
jgi:hypothetical protein